MNQRQVPALAVEPPRPGTELQRFHRSPAGFVDPLPYRGRQRAGVGRIRVPAWQSSRPAPWSRAFPSCRWDHL